MAVVNELHNTRSGGRIFRTRTVLGIKVYTIHIHIHTHIHITEEADRMKILQQITTMHAASHSHLLLPHKVN